MRTALIASNTPVFSTSPPMTRVIDAAVTSRPSTQTSRQIRFGAWNGHHDSYNNGSYNREILEAYDFVLENYRFQVRKGTRIPYHVHPTNVAGLVMYHALNNSRPDNGHPDLLELPSAEFPDGISIKDAYIAALMHDLIEDNGGPDMEQKLREQFGETVARLVLYCSDQKDESTRNLTYNERKREYLQRIVNGPDIVMLIKLCDMLDNLRLGRLTYMQRGEDYWQDFKTTKEQKLRYYHDAIDIFRASGKYPATVKEFGDVLDRFEQNMDERSMPLWQAKLRQAKRSFVAAFNLFWLELKAFLRLFTPPGSPSPDGNHPAFPRSR
jgi:hypothetical protein